MTPGVESRFPSGLFDRLRADGSELLELVFRHADRHRLQIVITELSRDAGPGAGPGLPVRHAFREDAEYFYPASAIKLGAAVAALASIRLFARDSGVPLTADTPFRVHPAFPDQSIEDTDPTNFSKTRTFGRFTVSHEINKMCLVSDNPAFNRLYTLVGHRAMNQLLWDAGLTSARVNHRLDDPRTREQNRLTGRVDFVDGRGGALLSIPERRSDLIVDNAGVAGLEIGSAHVPGTDSGAPPTPPSHPDAPLAMTIQSPMSFLHKNRISLADLHRLLLMIVRPDLEPGALRIGLNHDDLDRIRSAMSMFPGGSLNPLYRRERYADHFVKHLLPGLDHVLGNTPGQRAVITNKMGQAYGFTVENALVRHPRLSCDLAVTAVIYANARGVLGRDSYDYKTIAEPFMADLGAALARVFVERPRS